MRNIPMTRNKAEAIKEARRRMSNAGHTRQDGPLNFKAEEVD